MHATSCSARQLLAYLAIALLLSGSAGARDVADAAGRTVTVPDRIERAFGTAPPATFLLEVVAPGTLVGTNLPGDSPYFSADHPTLPDRYRKLPAVGGWHGSAKGANMEALLALAPQVVIGWHNDYVMEPVLRTFGRFGIPVVFVDEDKVSDEPAALRIVGLATGRPDVGERLAKDAENRLAQVRALVARVPESERPVVYYAEDADGLSTEFEGSFHFDPFLFAGARAAFPGAQTTMIGRERVTLEEVLRIDPAVIVTDNAEFAAKVRRDPRWAGVAAVEAGRVYLVPKEPVSFLDRPPCFMRILGVQWLASVLHPDRYDGDIVEETVTFYRDYLHCEVTPEAAGEILGR